MLNRAKFHFDNHYSCLKVGPYKVLQIGDLSCEPGYTVGPHDQEMYEITYVVSGLGTLHINEKAYPMRAGDLFLNRIGEQHNIFSSWEAPVRFYYLGFMLDEPQPEEKYLKIWHVLEQSSDSVMHKVTNIQQPFANLLGEIYCNDKFSDILVESYVHQIVSLCCRSLVPCPAHSYQVNESKSSDEKLIYDVVQYLDTHMEDLEDLTELGRIFGYSYTYISTRFTERMEESLKKYYTRKRFEKAQEYLANGESVTKVAEMVGYKSIHAFSRAFRKEVGISPKGYKEQQTGLTTENKTIMTTKEK